MDGRTPEQVGEAVLAELRDALIGTVEADAIGLIQSQCDRSAARWANVFPGLMPRVMVPPKVWQLARLGEWRRIVVVTESGKCEAECGHDAPAWAICAAVGAGSIWEGGAR